MTTNRINVRFVDPDGGNPGDTPTISPDGLTVEWGAGGGGVTVLDDLADVDTTTTPPTQGQGIYFDTTAGMFLPGDPPAGGGSSGTSSPTLLVRDGVVPLEPVGMDGDPDVWLYTDTTATGGGAGGVTDHGALTGLADDDHPQYVKGLAGRSYGLLGGVLRKNNGSWFLLNDAGHRPLGLGTVTADSTYVYVAVTPPGSMVTSVVVGPDETFAGMYQAGASVAKDKLSIKISDLNGNALNPLTIPDAPFGNFWIIGTMEA